MASRHAAAHVLFAAYIHVAGAPAHAQNAPITNAPITNPPNVITPPDALSDMVITDMKTSTICNPNGTTIATIKVTVANLGKGTADLSKDPMHVIVNASWWAATPEALAQPGAPVPIGPAAGGPATFKTAQSWTTTLTIAGIPAMKKNLRNPGLHGVMVNVDPANKLPETDEMNNHRSDTFFDPCFYKK